MSDVEYTFSRTEDGLVHACATLQGKPRIVCGANPDSVAERMFVAGVTCIACMARMRDVPGEGDLEQQLRDSLANRTIGEYAKDDAKTTLKLWQNLKARVC